MLGTPDYIAPEQTLSPQTADIRADIYSLGSCNARLPFLKGGPPFTGSSLFEILQSHQLKDPRAGRSAPHRCPGRAHCRRLQDDGQATGPSVPDTGRGRPGTCALFQERESGSFRAGLEPAGRSTGSVAPFALGPDRHRATARPASANLEPPESARFASAAELAPWFHPIKCQAADSGQENPGGCGRPWRWGFSCSPGSPPGPPGIFTASPRNSPQQTGSPHRYQPR